MELKNNLTTKINANLIIKSLVWSIVLETVQEEKGKQMQSYLQSISIRGKVISIKTGNPLVNFEIQSLENTIKEKTKKKLKQVGVSFDDFEMRYL